MHRRLKRIAAASAVSVLTLLGGAGVAQAGSYTHDKESIYFITGEGVRTQSPFNWADDGQNGSGTWIQLFGCHFSNSWSGNPEPKLRLKTEVNNWPDANMGDRTFASCRVGSSQNWGNQTIAAMYHFDVLDVDVVLTSVDTLHATKTVVTY